MIETAQQQVQQPENDSTDYDTDNVSDGDFESDGDGFGGSVTSSKMSDEGDHLVDAAPVAKKGDEVDLSGFHELCRKIVARPLPKGYSTGILCRYKYSSAAERVQLEKQQKKEKRKQAKTKRTWENVARVDMELNAHEKELHGLARRGVIDFFNAIEKHQSELKRKLEDAGPTELRQSKVIKDLKESDITDKLDGEQKKSASKWLDKGLTVPEDGSDEEADEEMEA